MKLLIRAGLFVCFWSEKGDRLCLKMNWPFYKERLFKQKRLLSLAANTVCIPLFLNWSTWYFLKDTFYSVYIKFGTAVIGVDTVLLLFNIGKLCITESCDFS
mgnify:CR=1 FL=1